MQKRALSLLAACGLFQVAMGIYFFVLRPAMLAEDERLTGLSLEAVTRIFARFPYGLIACLPRLAATLPPAADLARGNPAMEPAHFTHRADVDRGCGRGVRGSHERNELRHPFRLPMAAAAAGLCVGRRRTAAWG
jgi:hypothetical protein